jgi:hypothetical protein
VWHYDVLAFIDRGRRLQEASHGERARDHVDRSAWARSDAISSGMTRVTSECTNVQFTTIALAAPALQVILRALRVARHLLLPRLHSRERSLTMLWTIFVILLILWLLGMVSGSTLGGFIHLLLVLAIVVVLIRVIQGRRPI